VKLGEKNMSDNENRGNSGGGCGGCLGMIIIIWLLFYGGCHKIESLLDTQIEANKKIIESTEKK